MPELSQQTLGKVIRALPEIVPDYLIDFSEMRNFWRTKLFEEGFPDWFIQWALSLSSNWSVIVTELFEGRAVTENKVQVGEELCRIMLRKLTMLAVKESQGSTQKALVASIRSDGFSLRETVSSVASPQKLEVTSAVVEAALNDAEILIRSSGPPNALDRVHTAFQGYLEKICEDADIPVAKDAPITTLFAQIRQKHPKLQLVDAQADQMMTQILRGSAQIVDALNPVRNRKSLAHPNPLLDEAEAMLAINAIRTMLHYLDKRLK
jgi:Abortive infection C-terminus